MTEPHEPASSGMRPTKSNTEARGNLPASKGFALAILALLIAYGWPLYNLVRFALHSDLYSHILLVPFISGWLIWMKRQTLPPRSTPNRGLVIALLLAGAVTLGGYWAAILTGGELGQEDALALTTLSFLLCFSGICGWFLGQKVLRAIAFPLGFLIFMLPIPNFLIVWIETFLQHTSAATAYGLFKLSGTTVFFEDLSFRLPGINLRVAPECSGIHSTLALLITSLLAGHLFLRKPWKCAVLALAVIPLAILRNGFRIYTIGELCVHISPDMIDSYIHRHGGPLFFALSLIPFAFLLRFLVNSDQADRKSPSPSPGK